MALIATCIEHAGVARIFFDMRAVAPSPNEQRDIAKAIEQAYALAEAHTDTEQRPLAD